MSHQQPALTGLIGLLWFLEQMIRSLDPYLPAPPSAMLARLCRLLSGKALADQACCGVCAMLLAKRAVLASSLRVSLAAGLPTPATEAGRVLPTKPAPVPPANAGALETGAVPAAPPGMLSATCEPFERAVVLSGSGVSTGALSADTNDADKVVPLKPDEDASGLDLRSALPAASRAGRSRGQAHGVAHATVDRVRGRR